MPITHAYSLNGYNIIIDGNSGAIHGVDPVAFMCIKLYDELVVKTFPVGFKNHMAELSKISADEAFAALEHAYRIYTEKKDDVLSAGNSALNLKSENRQLFDYLTAEAGVIDGVLNSGCGSDVKLSDVIEVLLDIRELTLCDELFTEDVYEGIAAGLKKSQSTLKAICLHVAHGCNMRCGYCFAGDGEYNGSKALMDDATAKAAIDFLIRESKNRRNLEVDFFGGEPLLNFDVIKNTVKYARSIEKSANKNFRFTLTTNGILIDDEVIEFSNEQMSNVVMSLDGRKEEHDRMRKHAGLGSYELIKDKFIKFAKARKQKDYYIRGTYTGYNTDFSKDVLHIADLGFDEISLEPVVACDEAEYSINESNIDSVLSEYERLSLEMLKRERASRGFNFYHFKIDFNNGACISKRLSGCGVGSEYLAVTPEGDLYPCHQFVGKDEYILGNVNDGITEDERLKLFTELTLYSRKECKTCFAKLFCSGGCAANSLNYAGDITGQYEIGCRIHKKRIECAIMMEMDRNS